MTVHEKYMHRCLELAKLGFGNVAPNPMVGAVLVYNDTLIGEGYHQRYGEAHAEVNCINSVADENKKLIGKSTLYVSLEPCAHFGKTPPCADLIVDKKIPNVVIACRDSFAQVDGKGIQKLMNAGINVKVGILEKEAITLNKRFFTFHAQHRPYIILKWAQSKDKKIALADFSSVAISNAQTNKLVHKWRSEEMAIMVGTNTALHDDPSLTTRHWSGKNPVRIVIDKALKLPKSLHLFDGTVKTIVFNTIKNEEAGLLSYIKISEKENIIPQILQALYQLKIQSVIVEGGAKLLQSFIDQNFWDEGRIITNTELTIGDGINAPVFLGDHLLSTQQISTDNVDIYLNPNPPTN
ncbi:bifunctional diaminohydroxyphosphoribosylaminopyrimidine deaminase/5-amino-6-(5-phosphoribosylamino)uracil reductase RibD [Ferruginibacter lapsinanis]|uniref:bifunctional diaminohydroxyphosphoribosylaminopyrimidine deaminase/5-amino-6-(5-phosphoribosylamino)uracil reductase RibD n=1 Tax=Ferruginibacter lapsinanis TaxID=563172 RepID=UPI001E60059A|nr:bifunctional diaminohydroxyphosphoribosylaminopyrimidine deaminase/5-amino-6-(5-phosphoribosylamino)uracil reductase RibD [Ferruginibacter lapsinanis]UEG51251.1 bifunctional diaminohydroxyphosphoribosylaminopyrimidine deaminase/5-amino-6-(5-phosphoribosylamino)uracil reductase RibD [Ferruginibacter lapsinanis]